MSSRPVSRSACSSVPVKRYMRQGQRRLTALSHGCRASDHRVHRGLSAVRDGVRVDFEARRGGVLELARSRRVAADRDRRHDSRSAATCLEPRVLGPRRAAKDGCSRWGTAVPRQQRPEGARKGTDGGTRRPDRPCGARLPARKGRHHQTPLPQPGTTKPKRRGAAHGSGRRQRGADPRRPGMQAREPRPRRRTTGARPSSLARQGLGGDAGERPIGQVTPRRVTHTSQTAASGTPPAQRIAHASRRARRAARRSANSAGPRRHRRKRAPAAGASRAFLRQAKSPPRGAAGGKPSSRVQTQRIPGMRAGDPERQRPKRYRRGGRPHPPARSARNGEPQQPAKPHRARGRGVAHRAAVHAPPQRIAGSERAGSARLQVRRRPTIMPADALRERYGSATAGLLGRLDPRTVRPARGTRRLPRPRLPFAECDEHPGRS